MSAGLVRWYVPARRVPGQWITPAGVLEVAARSEQTPPAGFVVPSAAPPDPGDLAAIFNSA